LDLERLRGIKNNGSEWRSRIGRDRLVGDVSLRTDSIFLIQSRTVAACQLHEMAAPSFAVAVCADAKDEDGHEEECYNDPACPSEAHLGVQLVAIDDIVLRFRAVNPAVERCGYARSASSPEYPNQAQENRMASNADDSGAAMSGVEEESDVDDREEDGEPRSEREEAGSIPNADVQVVVVLVESRSKPSRDRAVDSSEDDEKTETTGVATTDHSFLMNHDYRSLVVKRVVRGVRELKVVDTAAAG